MSARWYKRCGADFIHGTMMLTLEEKGAYSICLDLIYDRGGPIPDDPRWLSGVCGVSMRKWNAIRDRLISLGKLVSENGRLSNSRADLEIVSAEKYARNQAEAGAKGGRKRAENASAPKENNDLGQASLKPIEEIREDKSSEDKSSGTVVPIGAIDFCKAVFDAGVALLTKTGMSASNARSMVGLWRKSLGDPEILTLIRQAEADGYSDPAAWLIAAVETRGGKRTPESRARYVSEGGYVYRSHDPEEVMREAEKRSDWTTYYAAKSDKENRRAQA